MQVTNQTALSATSGSTSASLASAPSPFGADTVELGSGRGNTSAPFRAMAALKAFYAFNAYINQ